MNFSQFFADSPASNLSVMGWQDPSLYRDSLLFRGKEPGTIALVVMYTLSFVLGLGGNGTALAVLTRRRGASATRRLLLNLTVCDTLVVCLCMPVNLGHQVYQAWVFGGPLCRAVPFVQAVSVSASVLSLAAVSLRRYCGVRSPLRARCFFTGRRTLAVIVAVWAASSGLCLPIALVNETRTLALDGARPVSVCVESWWQPRLRQAYNLLLCCALYALPAAFNLTVCCLTARQLRRLDEQVGAHGAGRLAARKRVARMVVALVLLFTVSWLPLYAVDIWIDFNLPGASDGGLHHRTHEWLLQSRPFALWLGLTNSALNPLCYCLVGDLSRSARRLRRSYRKKLSCVFGVPQRPGGNGESQATRASAERGWRTYATRFRDSLTKSKSLSSITVCESVFN